MSALPTDVARVVSEVCADAKVWKGLGALNSEIHSWNKLPEVQKAAKNGFLTEREYQLRVKLGEMPIDVKGDKEELGRLKGTLRKYYFPGRTNSEIDGNLFQDLFNRPESDELKKLVIDIVRHIGSTKGIVTFKYNVLPNGEFHGPVRVLFPRTKMQANGQMGLFIVGFDDNDDSINYTLECMIDSVAKTATYPTFYDHEGKSVLTLDKTILEKLFEHNQHF